MVVCTAILFQPFILSAVIMTTFRSTVSGAACGISGFQFEGLGFGVQELRFDRSPVGCCPVWPRHI